MGRMATEQRIRMFQIGEEGHVEHDEGKTDDKRQGKIGSSGGASSQSLSKLGDEGHEQGDENGEDRWNGKLSEKSGPPQRQGNGILEFPNELLLLILRHVDTDPGPISIESRPWMSVVSFKYETMIPRDPNAVGNFRRSCRKFSEVGLEHQYKRLATEFSAKGLERLRNIAGKPHLANAVQKFTYLVPTLFFNDASQVSSICAAIGENGHTVPEALVNKAMEQIHLVHSLVDLQSLTLAFTAFRQLQHVALLSFQSEIDSPFIAYMQTHHSNFPTALRPSWTSFYLHGVRTLGRSFLASNSPAKRLSLPMIDADTGMALQHSPDRSVHLVAQKLQCLLVRFKDPEEFAREAAGLAGLIQMVLIQAADLVTLHIGFPKGRPANVELEVVFQSITMPKLKVLSIESWRLTADEIIALVRRHRSTLSGLRLRAVLLKGGRWRDILVFLRRECRLRWLSLSEADYENGDGNGIAQGVDVTHLENSLWGSDVEDDFDYRSNSDQDSDDDNDSHIGRSRHSDTDSHSMTSEASTTSAPDDPQWESNGASNVYSELHARNPRNSSPSSHSFHTSDNEDSGNETDDETETEAKMNAMSDDEHEIHDEQREEREPSPRGLGENICMCSRLDELLMVGEVGAFVDGTVEVIDTESGIRYEGFNPTEFGESSAFVGVENVRLVTGAKGLGKEVADDGKMVTRRQRVAWETWVRTKCPIHGMGGIIE